MAYMRNDKNVYRNFVAKSERKRLLRRYSSVWKDNIRMDFKGGL